ncbi:MAG: hypothetical protein GY953_36755 [bacterium]|nr:hypothetical protein [bacterium]
MVDNRSDQLTGGRTTVIAGDRILVNDAVAQAAPYKVVAASDKNKDGSTANRGGLVAVDLGGSGDGTKTHIA